MQIAKMFASLGFNVDDTGLKKFKQSLASARSELTNVGRGTKQTTQQLRSLSRALDSVDARLNKIKGSAVNKNIRQGYEGIASSVRRVDKAFNSISANQKTTTKALGKIHSSVISGAKHWDQYRISVLGVRDALRQVRVRLDDIRARANIRVNIRDRNNGAGGNGGAGGFGGNGGRGFGGGFGRGGAGSNDFAGGFFRSMLPAVALAGGLPSLGYLGKEVVQRGREQQKMENVLMFSSKTNDNLVDFNDSLQFVRKTALELGTTSQELGKAFAQVNMSAGDTLNKDQKKELFHDMSKSFVTMGASKDEQFLLYKAVNQMFSLGRIQAEEMNQLTGQGLVPRQLVYAAVKEAYGVKSNAEVAALQKANKLDPAKILPILFRAMSGQADSSGAFKAYQESSLFQQNVLTERFNQASQSIMDNGADEMLAKLFSKLSELVELLTEFSMGAKAFKQGLDEMTNGNGILSIALTLVIGLLFKKRKLVVDVVKRLGSFSGIMRVITAFMNGNLGQALLRLLKRFGAIGVAITAITYGFTQIGKALKGRSLGDWTWLDTLIMKWKILQLRLDTYIMSLRIMWSNTKAQLNPNGEFGETERYGQVYGEAPKLKQSGLPSRNAGVVQKKEASEENQKRQKALDNILKAPQKQGIPYVGAGSQWKTPKVVNDFNVFINGVSVPDNQISISGATRQ